MSKIVFFNFLLVYSNSKVIIFRWLSNDSLLVILYVSWTFCIARTSWLILNLSSWSVSHSNGLQEARINVSLKFMCNHRRTNRQPILADSMSESKSCGDLFQWKMLSYRRIIVFSLPFWIFFVSIFSISLVLSFIGWKSRSHSQTPSYAECTMHMERGRWST